MANYYLQGYTPPSGVQSKEAVKAYQKQLGVTADGIWGPKTQAAYEGSLLSAQPQVQTQPQKSFADFYNEASLYIQPASVSAGSFSSEEFKKELEKQLRPALDTSIQRRRDAVGEQKAELDADAASRGMSSSTFLSSMKERAGSNAERDVAELEASYGAELSERLYKAMESYQQRVLDAQKFNAQSAAAAQSSAMQLASSLYGSYNTALAAEQAAQAQAMAMAQKAQTAAQSTNPKAKSAGSSKQSSSLSVDEIYELMDYLSPTERSKLFQGTGSYWSSAQEELRGSVSKTQYAALESQYGSGSATSSKKASSAVLPW